MQEKSANVSYGNQNIGNRYQKFIEVHLHLFSVRFLIYVI